MPKPELKEAVVRVLLVMEPHWAHDEVCPGKKDPSACNCYLLRNTVARADALDNAGLLVADF
jgi:hypothetical protein